MDKNTFDLLMLLLEADGQYTEESLAKALALPKESICTMLAALNANGWLSEGKITAVAITALEPYKVKRAIFMAAGFGSRMVPITLNTPKPLVRVKDKRIIDTVLDAVIAAGIEEIIIVRGYLGEQFDQLLYKYPSVKFVDNPLYNEANNISSVLCVRDMLRNAYVLEADLVLSNPSLIKKYQYRSNFLGIKVNASDDWCFVVKDGIITAQIPNGNEYKNKLATDEQLYQEVGISYWDADDGAKLAHHIKEVFDRPEGKNRYWDQVQFVDYADSYRVAIRACDKSDIVEIDSFKELVAIDERYSVK